MKNWIIAMTLAAMWAAGLPGEAQGASGIEGLTIETMPKICSTDGCVDPAVAVVAGLMDVDVKWHDYGMQTPGLCYYYWRRPYPEYEKKWDESLKGMDKVRSFGKSPIDNLISGSADIAFIIGDITEDQINRGKEKGVSFVSKKYAKDALVFIVNGDKPPVDRLTTENIVKIYSGKVTNWKDLGGGDMEIVPLLGNETFGGTGEFEKLMGAEKITAKEYFNEIFGSHFFQIDFLNTLGFVHYNAFANMVGCTRTKPVILPVDGVMPDEKSILDGTYPHMVDLTVAIRNDASETTKKVYDLITTDAMQMKMSKAGLIPLESKNSGAEMTTADGEENATSTAYFDVTGRRCDKDRKGIVIKVEMKGGRVTGRSKIMNR